MAAELVANEYRGEIQQGNYDFNNKTILDVQMVFFLAWGNFFYSFSFIVTVIVIENEL